MILVVMGVTGVGKSTLGQALAARLGWEFIDADDYHPAANISKMRSGIALTDVDRQPWLDRIHHRIETLEEACTSAVLACSALKAAYREQLTGQVSSLQFVYLEARPDMLRNRLQHRTQHFMSPQLLDSQLAILEPPEAALWVLAELPVEQQVDEICAALVPEACG